MVFDQLFPSKRLPKTSLITSQLTSIYPKKACPQNSLEALRIQQRHVLVIQFPSLKPYAGFGSPFINQCMVRHRYLKHTDEVLRG